MRYEKTNTAAMRHEKNQISLGISLISLLCPLEASYPSRREREREGGGGEREREGGQTCNYKKGSV